MKTYTYFIIAFATISMVFSSCSKADDNDTEKPVVNLDGIDAFPQPCDTLHRGQTFTFRANFTDNVELGFYNLELHNNFDHHTHGSHQETCPTDPDKEPVNPFYFNQTYEIPSGSQSYDAEVQVTIPSDVDTGDYHFMVKVTDINGWSAWQSVSVKIF